MGSTHTLAADDAPAPPASGRLLTYQPALDGVRAVAVIAVLLFHAEVPGFNGGYLGVSVFFTLSGFLITSLLVAEVERSGEVAVGAFYARRARRLLPASVLCVGGVVLLAAVTDWFDGVTELRRHAIGSLLQIANWVFLAGEGSYQQLLDETAGTPSPLEHYWSLAIEEQFYWLWPIAFFGLVRLAKTPAGGRRAVGAVTVVAVIAAPVVAIVWGADAAYWSTPARAAEVLLGALLAVVIAGRQLDARWAIAAPVAFAVLAVAVVTFPAASGPAYAGALPAVAVVSAALLLGLQVHGPVREALSRAPLVWLGRISYGVYLFHWPIFVIVDAERTGIDGAPLVLLRLALTLAVAQVSFTLFEQPIRRAESLTIRPTMIGAAVATAAVVFAAVVVVPAADSDYWTVSADTAEQAAIEPTDEPLTALVASSAPTTTDAPAITAAPTTSPATSTATAAPSTRPATTVAPTTTVAPGPPPLPPLSRPVRVVVSGDSTAVATGAGVVSWAAANPELAQVEMAAAPGCGFLGGGDYLVRGEWRPAPDVCAEWVERMPDNVAALEPDVVGLLTTSWDVLDRRLPGTEGGAPTDPEIAARIASEFERLTTRLLASGANVAWIREPIPDPFWLEETQEQEEPARHAVLYAVMDDLAERFPGQVFVIDLPAWLAAEGLDTDQDARPDGVHWTPEVATRIATDYLGEQLIRAALDLEPV